MPEETEREILAKRQKNRSKRVMALSSRRLDALERNQD